MDNFIIINAPMGCRGHQVGRLLASCDNVLWYDHFKNGNQPWLPSFGLGRTFSNYHFTRRFKGAYGIGTDGLTVPPILERADANGFELKPLEKLQEWSERVYPNNIIIVTHGKLNETKEIFPDAKHIIVCPLNIKETVERIKIVGADYRWGKKQDYTLRDAFTVEGKTFEDSMAESLKEIIDSYALATDKDIVINSSDELLNDQFFNAVCYKFNLTFNKTSYTKVKQFVNGDKAAPQYETYSLSNKDILLVEEFLAECDKRNFKNNSSLKALKWDWCTSEGGKWFGTVKQGKIVSMSGIHPFKDGYRALFRGAQLESRHVKGLNRYQFQSWPFYAHLPLQIEWARWQGSDKIYITTNVTNDESGRMNRVHKSFVPLEKAGVVTHCGIEEVFYTQQSVWQLNVDRYFEVREMHDEAS
jgi:hypothetical protein